MRTAMMFFNQQIICFQESPIWKVWIYQGQYHMWKFLSQKCLISFLNTFWSTYIRRSWSLMHSEEIPVPCFILRRYMSVSIRHKRLVETHLHWEKKYEKTSKGICMFIFNTFERSEEQSKLKTYRWRKK